VPLLGLGLGFLEFELNELELVLHAPLKPQASLGPS